jgi:hypothetical protein
VINKLEGNRFDQAPVFDRETRKLWGLVETIYLKSLLGQQADLGADDPMIMREKIEFRVGDFVTINDLFERMKQNRAVIVIQESGNKGDSHNAPIYGLFTISDLNRHDVRGIIYLQLCTVEAGLARLVERILPEPWEWLSFLKEHSQVQALGSWELSKRRSVDIAPIAGINLSDLIDVVNRSEKITKALGYSSAREFSKNIGSIGSISDLRNRVMHPVRPLVLGLDDVTKIHQSLNVLKRLRNRLDEFLNTHRIQAWRRSGASVNSDNYRHKAGCNEEVR